MKKIVTLLLCFLLLCGCESLNYEMMVCSYHGMESLYYEIRYSGDVIRNIVVVEYMDLKEVPDVAYEERLAHFDKKMKIMERYAGIDTHLENDERELTQKTVVDHQKYDCYKDSLSLFKVDIEEGDLDSVEALRNKLSSNGCECDVLVSLEAMELEENE